ncbi:hypothetical protein S40288_03390 [Stachybotrys chartarum IBT 40288]|nr:hypothetical protein S40288_03390 [Stachybotrys chartarum IBT 40288]
MLTIAQVSGLIAAAAVVVQYALPAGLVVILVGYAGNENNAATWSSINRTISNTIWPLILQADSVGTKNLGFVAVALSWTMTLGALLLVLAGVMTPLGLRDEILPSKTEPIDFQYASDPTSWGTVTMARPNRPFGRYCEYGRRINCPGQYQGVDFNETSEGNFRSVKTDDSSTVNTTVPANYTAMFSSATAGAGNTVSGLFDIQYRRWAINFEDIIDHGEPRITGNYRYIETLIPQEDVLLKEGLIVDSVLPPSDFVDRYEDGRRKLFASNFTAIRNICRGFYILDDTSIDWRATNITNPAVECATYRRQWMDLKSRGRTYMSAQAGSEPASRPSTFDTTGPTDILSNLMVERISNKEYPNEQSKPLWAVEHSEPWRMTFHPLWGIVNNSYEATEGFYTMRSDKLWLPATVTSGSLFGSRNGMDSLAAVSAPVLNMANAYDILSDQEQYVGDLSYPLVRRFSRLSSNETLASQIPSLIIADSLASLLIGTKTAIRTDPVAYPAQLSFSDPLRGLARANVVAYARVIRYDLRYAIPGLVMLSLLMLILLWTVIVLVLSPRSLLRSLRDMYNQTSTGRLATTLLYPGRSDPNESSSKWVEGGGNLVLKFGRIGNRESEYFLVVGEDSEKSLLHHGHQEHQMKTFETKDGIREQSVPLQGD